jgi:hypothetical protein
MRSTHLPVIAKVRLLTGALGERYAWWRTQFTTETAKRSLEMLFPQTSTRAALESVTEAARRIHDTQLLAPRAFHLFRLPIHLEDRLAGWLAKPETSLAWPPAQDDAVLTELERTGGKGSGAAAQGPVCLGKPARLNHEPAFKELAAVYLQAARGGVRVFPYFED